MRQRATLPKARPRGDGVFDVKQEDWDVRGFAILSPQQDKRSVGESMAGERFVVRRGNASQGRIYFAEFSRGKSQLFHRVGESATETWMALQVLQSSQAALDCH